MLSAWLSYCSRRLHRGSIRTSLGGRERIVKNRDAALILAFRRLPPFITGCSARTSWVFVLTSGPPPLHERNPGPQERTEEAGTLWQRGGRDHNSDYVDCSGIPESGINGKIEGDAPRHERSDQKRFPRSIVTSGNACKAILSLEWVSSEYVLAWFRRYILTTFAATSTIQYSGIPASW